MGFSTNNWVGSPGFSGGGGTSFNPSWSNSFKYDGGFPSGSGNNYSPGGFSGIGTDPDTWRKGFALAGEDPFGLNKNKDKKNPWEERFRAAGEKLAGLGQSQYGQNSGSDKLAVGGAGGVSQSGELTIIQPAAPTILPPQQSTFSRIAGTLAPFASLIPGVGPLISAGLGAASSLG
jgi:hypothetical protein